jgi:hypothetical protein
VDDFDEVLTTAQRRHTRWAVLVALVATTVMAAAVLVVLAPLDAGGQATYMNVCRLAGPEVAR